MPPTMEDSKHLIPFRFVDLPREIRDRVYSLVLALRVAPPPDANELGPKMSASNDRVHDKGISYEKKAIVFSASSLLLCNRQIATEMHEEISRQSENVLWHLDCGITSRVGMLRLTWLALPVPPRYLRRIKVDLRVLVDKRIRWNGDGGPGPPVQDLLRLLGTFVAYGPGFCPNNRQRWSLNVHMIELEF